MSDTEATLEPLTLYQCNNTACTLGSRSAPGHFTGGMTQQHAEILTGNAEAPFGEGICPNCGEQGEEVGTH